MDWKKELSALFGQDKSRPSPRTREDVVHFIENVVAPALAEVCREIERKHSLSTRLERDAERVTLIVLDANGGDFEFGVRLRTFKRPSFVFPEMRFKDDETRYYRAEVHINGEPQGYGVYGYPKERVIQIFLHEFEKYLRWHRIG